MASTETERLHLLRRLMLMGRDSGDTISIPKPILAELLKTAFSDLVDSDWYLERYPDVAEAIAREQVPSALEHYALSGLYEGRMPYSVPLDAAAYLRQHRDVAASVKSGEFESAQDHFATAGFAEGRAFRVEAGTTTNQ